MNHCFFQGERVQCNQLAVKWLVGLYEMGYHIIAQHWSFFLDGWTIARATARSSLCLGVCSVGPMHSRLCCHSHSIHGPLHGQAGDRGSWGQLARFCVLGLCLLHGECGEFMSSGCYHQVTFLSIWSRLPGALPQTLPIGRICLPWPFWSPPLRGTVLQ